MKDKLIKLTKVILLPIILVSISCNTKNNDSKEVFNFTNEKIDYRVFENYSKVNSTNIDQCEKFLEYKNNKNGFEIHGADIADLFSILFGVDRNRINLKNKKAIFYSVSYNGANDHQLKRKIFKQLIDKRDLKVSRTLFEKEVHTVSQEKSKKISFYINPRTNEEGSVILNDNKYVLENVNFIVFTKTLNELYPNSFVYEENDKQRYNLEIPLGKTKNSIISYLKDNYDISFIRVNRKIEGYEIDNK